MKILKIIGVILVIGIGFCYFKYYNLKTANGDAPKILQQLLTEDALLVLSLNNLLDNNATKLVAESCKWNLGFLKDANEPFPMCQLNVINAQGQKIHISIALIKDPQIKRLRNQSFREQNKHDLTTNEKVLNSDDIYLVQVLFGENKGDDVYSVKYYSYSPETKSLGKI